MQSETKNCQNCKTDFTIESEDFAFYEKIKVPPPTWCPECRMTRRFLWRNERTLHKRKCDVPGHEEMIISIYPPEAQVVVYDKDYWWTDGWNAMDYGQVYDFSKGFFSQINRLLQKVPCNNLLTEGNVNSDYTNFQTSSNNCYLIFGGAYNENVIYANHGDKSKDSVDLYFFASLELCYGDTICQNSFRLLFGQNCDNCSDSAFLTDCRNCQNCFGCVGLRNKQYYMFNEPLTKEEYRRRVKEIDLRSFREISKYRSRFDKAKLMFPRKFANVLTSHNVSGDNIVDAKNTKYGFDVLQGGCEDSKYFFWGGGNMKDVYDGTGVGVQSELLYEGVSIALGNAEVFFSVVTRNCHDVYYSYNCHSSSHLFACVGLRNKQYCILNKQYTKEEYESLVPKIIKHMNEMPYVDKKGRIYTYGEFFPSELSPFAYNETIAQEYFPLTKEEAEKQGYRWRDPDTKDYKITTKPDDLSDHIKDVPDSITQEVIGCAHQGTCNHQCTTAFKIIPQELQFYRKMNLPLPRLCPNCRHYERLKQRNPLKLWHRQCECEGQKSKAKGQNQYTNTATHTHGDQACSTEFETSYAPDRPEIVYCESCYQQEVV